MKRQMLVDDHFERIDESDLHSEHYVLPVEGMVKNPDHNPFPRPVINASNINVVVMFPEWGEVLGNIDDFETSVSDYERHCAQRTAECELLW